MFNPSPQLLRALGNVVQRHGQIHLSSTKRTFQIWRRQPSSRQIVQQHCGPITSSFCRTVTGGPPKTRDRGPTSQEDTQTDFGVMDILKNTKAPATYIDACLGDGFHLDNGIKTTGGSGIFLIGGSAFTWQPDLRLSSQDTAGGGGREALSRAPKLDIRGFTSSAWGLIELLWPKPDMVIIGTGHKLWQLSEQTKSLVNELGVKIDVMDTGNAAAAYNLLATERGTENITAALLPLDYKGHEFGSSPRSKG